MYITLGIYDDDDDDVPIFTANRLLKYTILNMKLGHGLKMLTPLKMLIHKTEKKLFRHGCVASVIKFMKCG